MWHTFECQLAGELHSFHIVLSLECQVKLIGVTAISLSLPEIRKEWWSYKCESFQMSTSGWPAPLAQEGQVCSSVIILPPVMFCFNAKQPRGIPGWAKQLFNIFFTSCLIIPSHFSTCFLPSWGHFPLNLDGDISLQTSSFFPSSCCLTGPPVSLKEAMCFVLQKQWWTGFSWHHCFWSGSFQADWCWHDFFIYLKCGNIHLFTFTCLLPCLSFKEVRAKNWLLLAFILHLERSYETEKANSNKLAPHDSPGDFHNKVRDFRDSMMMCSFFSKPWLNQPWLNTICKTKSINSRDHYFSSKQYILGTQIICSSSWSGL